MKTKYPLGFIHSAIEYLSQSAEQVFP